MPGLKLKDIAKALSGNGNIWVHQLVDKETGQITRQWIGGYGRDYALQDDLPKIMTGNEILAMMDAKEREKYPGEIVTIAHIENPLIADADATDVPAEKMDVGFSFFGVEYIAMRVGDEVMALYPRAVAPTDKCEDRTIWKRGNNLIVKEGMLAVARIGPAKPWHSAEGERLVSGMEELAAMMGLSVADVSEG